VRPGKGSNAGAGEGSRRARRGAGVASCVSCLRVGQAGSAVRMKWHIAWRVQCQHYCCGCCIPAKELRPHFWP
jgi:hypothetical protein